MKALVIHNNNLPFFLRSGESFSIEDVSFDSRFLKNGKKLQLKGFDGFISEELSFLKDNFYDIIILPFSLSETNYLEYTGVRVAAHIRLTLSWNKLTTPILFVGPDTCDDIIKLSPLGIIINSYRMYHTDTTNQRELIEVIKNIVNNNPDGGDEEYLQSRRYPKMLNSLYITPPANYDTHHSIANEWAIIRWLNMFDWKDNVPDIENKLVFDSLYFKYLIAKVSNQEGRRQVFTKKWKRNNPIAPVIKGIEGKRIMYIDDEGNKGWNKLLKRIFDNSKAELIYYPFSQEETKENLIENIKQFIDSNNADCYLIDLRLHDDDFHEEDSAKMSGLIVAKYIKQINKGNQIVMFTASNKMWNYEVAINKVGAIGYVIKESPEYNYNREESCQNFINFSQLIKKAINKAYLSKYVTLLEKCNTMNPNSWNALDSFIDLLLLDERKTIKANVLNLNLFLETYISSKFKIEDEKLIGKHNKEEYVKYNTKNIHLGKDLTYVRFYQNSTHLEEDEIYLDDKKSGYLAIILITLYYHYGINKQNCDLFLKLRDERNHTTAHEGKETSITVDEFKKIFEEIVSKIIDKDYL